MCVFVRFLFVYIISLRNVSNMINCAEFRAITIVSPIEHIADISGLLLEIYYLKKLVNFAVIELVTCWSEAST
jgi:hypothetical protein